MLSRLLFVFTLFCAFTAFFVRFAQTDHPIFVYETRPAVRSLATTLEMNAVVINSRQVTITASVDGKINKIVVREGDRVEVGQGMAELDTTVAKTQLEAAMAELKYSQQKYGLSLQTYSRLETLSKAGNASKQILQEGLDTIYNARAERSVSQANATLARLKFENATVNAPFNGIVTTQHAEAGQWVEAGTPIFDLIAESGYMIEAQVDASDWTKVSIGQTVSLSTESAPGEFWQSRVSWIAPTVEFDERDTKTVAIRFSIGDKPPPLLLGQELDAELVMERVDNVLSLPLSSMIEEAPGEYIVFVAVDGKARLVPVTVGLQNAKHAEITDGLTINDSVITSQDKALFEDTTIAIQHQ